MLLMVINGVLAGVVTVYLTTESIAVTVIAAIIALTLTALYWITQP